MNQIKRQRLEKRILRLVADLYFKELKDPNIGFATFTRCELSNDGSQARLFVSVYEEAAEKTKTLEALQRARGFIRSRIGKVISARIIPSVDFVLDESLEKADRIDQLLDGPAN